MGFSFDQIASLLQEDPDVKGRIVPRGKCPRCDKSFSFYPRLGYICDEHGIKPDRFRISIRGAYIYSDKQGKALDSFARAQDLFAFINQEIKDGTFEISKYVRSEKRAFFIDLLVLKFWAEKEAGLAPSYRADFKRMLDRASSFFKSKDVRELRRPDILDFSKTLDHYSPKSQKNHLDLLKGFLRWVRDDREMILRVPVISPIPQEAKIPRWISRGDQLRLLGFTPEEDRPIIAFLMTYGCRPGEARALRIRDVDWPRAINIHATFSGEEIRERRKGRGAPPLTLPIQEEVSDYIKTRIHQALPAAWLFSNPRTGDCYQEGALRRLWAKIRTAAGIVGPLRLYDASRHSVASQMKAAGVSLDNIKDILGHTDIRTTARYSHADLEGKKASLDKISGKVVWKWSGQKQAEKS